MSVNTTKNLLSNKRLVEPDTDAKLDSLRKHITILSICVRSTSVYVDASFSASSTVEMLAQIQTSSGDLEDFPVSNERVY